MSLRSRFKRAGAAVCLFLGGILPAVGAEEAGAGELFDGLQQQVQKLFEKSAGAVARIEAMDKHGQLSGSGFFIDPNGLLYTSYTVGGDTHDIVAIIGELKYPAQRVAADERSGIALLQVEAKTPFLPLGTSYDLAVATPVMTIGYPMDLPLTPSFGMLGGFDRKYLGRYFATTHLRANVAVQRGEGGAPLLNMKGEVVGILISSLDQGSASFVLPIEAAEKVRKDYVRFGEVRPGWLGLSVVSAAEARRGSTALVQDVFRDAPADKAGLLPDDLLLQIGGRKITCPEDMLDSCFFLSASDPVTVVVARGEEELKIQVETVDFPGRRPLNRVLSLSSDLPTAQPDALKIGE